METKTTQPKVNKAQKRQIAKRRLSGRKSFPSKRGKDNRSWEARREWRNKCALGALNRALDEVRPAAIRMVAASVSLAKQRVSLEYYNSVMRPLIDSAQKADRGKLSKAIRALPAPEPYSPLLSDLDKADLISEAMRLVASARPKSRSERLALKDISDVLDDISYLGEDKIQLAWSKYIACAKTHKGVINLPIKIAFTEDADILHLLRQRPIKVSA